jgi:hypothetical protein
MRRDARETDPDAVREYQRESQRRFRERRAQGVPLRKKHQVDEEGRECSTCEEYKPWDAFGVGTGPNDKERRCKACLVKKANDYAVRNPQARYVKKEVPYGSVINDEGRQCAYKREGNCGQQFKPWSEYNKGNNAHGYSGWCRDCSRQHHQNRPVAQRREYGLTTRLKAFGLTVEQYRVLEAKFGGRCWLCREFETLRNPSGELQRLGVDHDHQCCDFDPSPQHPLCGRCVRGLCCFHCNMQVLGNLESVGVEKVMAYLYAGYVTLPAVP